MHCTMCIQQRVSLFFLIAVTLNVYVKERMASARDDDGKCMLGGDTSSDFLDFKVCTNANFCAKNINVVSFKTSNSTFSLVSNASTLNASNTKIQS